MTSIDALLDRFLQTGGACIDSRRLEPGQCFFALSGKGVSGNSFAATAIRQGAAFAIVDDPAVIIEPSDQFVLVEDVLKTLQALANAYRGRFDIPVLAITGSNGKTTTKELVAAVLAMKYKVHYTKGNLNNHIGVPLTLLSMPEDTQFAVIEMGANAQGEIAALAAIAEPGFGLITNIGKAHLGGFGGQEGVKKGKSELYRYLDQAGGIAFYNADEAFLKSLIPVGLRSIAYGSGTDPDSIYTSVLLDESPQMVYEFNAGVAVHSGRSHLFGIYNFRNIQAAITLGLYFGVPAEDIAEAIESYIPDNNRSQTLQKGDLHIVLDAYNANPSSMRHAITAFAERPGDKVLILGDMFELGEESAQEHSELAAWLQGFDWAQVILVGDHFMQTAARKEWHYFPDAAAASAEIAGLIPGGSTVLIKGSRGMKLESLLPLIGPQSAA